MLYADSYRTKEEFRQMFDHRLYDKMRNQLECKKAFPDVYDKVSKRARSHWYEKGMLYNTSPFEMRAILP